jgi:hypothetical protein
MFAELFEKFLCHDEEGSLLFSQKQFINALNPSVY